ncbi:MAG: DUF302 domain-containing protein [Nitrospirota bacterium]|nr:DUF302 domain-containing protein [Nitrospirota bacterium]
MSTYGIAKRLDMDYAQAVEKVTEALKGEGFGVITSIDVKATMKAKLGRDFRPYVILGACNPNLAWEALNSEADVGLLLPCNVVVEEAEGGGSRVAAIDPEAMLSVTGRDDLKELAKDVKARLNRAIQNCG